MPQSGLRCAAGGPPMAIEGARDDRLMISPIASRVRPIVRWHMTAQICSSPQLDEALCSSPRSGRRRCCCRAARAGEGSYKALVKAVVGKAQAAGVAVLIEGDPGLVRMLGADGLHVEGDVSDVKAATAALKPDYIVGAGRSTSRHDAMSKGELGPGLSVLWAAFGTARSRAARDGALVGRDHGSAERAVRSRRDGGIGDRRGVGVHRPRRQRVDGARGRRRRGSRRSPRRWRPAREAAAVAALLVVGGAGAPALALERRRASTIASVLDNSCRRRTAPVADALSHQPGHLRAAATTPLGRSSAAIT